MMYSKICFHCWYFLEYPHWISKGDEFDPTPINHFDGMCRHRCIAVDKGHSCKDYLSDETARTYFD